MEEVTREKKIDLEVILSKLEESGMQLVAVREQLESLRILLDTLSMELESKNMELDSVAESSEPLKVYLEEKKKSLQALKNLITISEQLTSKSKELGEVQKLIEDQTKELFDTQQQQPPAVPTSDTSQQNAAAAAEPDDNLKALMCHENFLQPDDIAKSLRATFHVVLNQVLEQLREGGMLEDSVLKVLVLLLDELVKIQRTVKPQLKLKVTEVATLLKGNIRLHAPNSSLKALAFLLFLVADGLEKLINEKETVLLASIARYEQAPALFDSLGLSLGTIPETVNQLIDQSHYLLAVCCICHFKLRGYYSPSPSQFLQAEMTNLESVLTKRPAGSDQAKDKDSGRLNAILELSREYDLKIAPPKDVFVRLMVPQIQVDLDI